MPHRESLFVISDLHLGGDTGFQICTARGRRRLSAFIRSLPAQLAPGQSAHLVLAGDIVDFLAEQPFAAFTADDALATRKLARIMDHGDTADVWTALREFVSAGHTLTLLLGNHDLELSLPGPRHLLHQRIGHRGVEFLYDNQAFVRGPVLIEHGNRYDDWNAVPHDVLRAVRSALSRRESPPAMRTLAGSELVVGVMNGLKKQYAFIDLLKPENEAALPLLAVLDPGVLTQLKHITRLARQASRARVRRDDSGLPEDRELISGDAERPESQLLRTAQALTGYAEEEIGAIENLKSWWEVYQAGRTEDRREQLRRLRKALQLYVQAQQETFALNIESPRYLKPAEAIAQRGFQVVVFGHTHLVKRVRLPGDALYLNTGTWAELMRIPDEVLSHTAAGDTVLADFVEAMADNRLDPWRKLVPTFARIDLEGENLLSADVFVFEEDGRARTLDSAP
ncbi:metallophosphoesterase [Stigmatella sp. ncwal1]|uniref:Metallophosphoesterase n=1 Tax=Stigmatella ashevillensis TaxID=2995309 RepID=A0ABT5DJJ4_9BACT|nr:metallophosphoesterase [Stigmatella ashevillena]MDC0713798.1 metallophosphoesterase [Stigmatella ashevillena]